MADLAKVNKEYNSIIDKYSPKDKAISKATNVPRDNLYTSGLIKIALTVYEEYQSKKTKASDQIIQLLAAALKGANVEIEKYHESSVLIEHKERSKADTKQAITLAKERMPKSKGGKKGRTHAKKEPLAIDLFTNYDHKIINPNTGKKYTLSVIYEELELSLGTGKEWRKNFTRSNGKTVYKS